MRSQTCDRCKKAIKPGGAFYRLRIKVLAGFDGVINIKAEKMNLAKEFEKIKSYPEDLIEEEVYKTFDFILCPRCKEIYCANPLHLPLDSQKISDDA